MKKILLILMFLFSLIANGELNIEELRMRAENGEVEAQFNLGIIYYNGEGVPQDYRKSVYWYEKAANNGDTSAQYNLGLMYSSGEGVSQSDRKAYAWYSVAATNGHENALKNRDIVWDRLSSWQKKRAQKMALETYKRIYE